jgi:hypothetical protein
VLCACVGEEEQTVRPINIHLKTLWYITKVKVAAINAKIAMGFHAKLHYLANASPILKVIL